MIKCQVIAYNQIRDYEEQKEEEEKQKFIAKALGAKVT